MSKNSSVATEKPGTGVLRMVRVNCNYYISKRGNIFTDLFIFGFCGIIIYYLCEKCNDFK